MAAGRKAKLSAAYLAACEYCDAGRALLDGDDSAEARTLRFGLGVEGAECRYLAGLFERAEQDFETLLTLDLPSLDRALVHSLRVKLYEHQSRWREALTAGRSALSLVGIGLPDNDSDKQRSTPPCAPPSRRSKIAPFTRSSTCRRWPIPACRWS
jgi:predicted ATPase